MSDPQTIRLVVAAVQGILAEYKLKRAVLEQEQAAIVADFKQALQNQPKSA